MRQLLIASSYIASAKVLLRPAHSRIRMASKIRVYTRTGDAGTTSLFNGERRSKDELYFAALGDVDELNAHLGLAREHCGLEGVGIEEQLVEIQSRLLDAGSAIATPQRSSSPERLLRTGFPDHTAQLEGWIDAMDDTLPALKNFILPSGGVASAQLHVARTVCRRAERALVPLVREGDLDSGVSKYVNRLSDYLFVAARFAAAKAGKAEQVYKKVAVAPAAAAAAPAAAEAAPPSAAAATPA